MSLTELVDNTLTDKNTVHSYLPLYEKLFANQRETALNVLEIGICRGGSILLWSQYFTKAKVHAIDILDVHSINELLKNKDNILLYPSTDAYNKSFIADTFIANDVKFDVMLDDGPHTLESMCKFIKSYHHLMNENAIMVIEDVQNWEWIDILTDITPTHLKQYIKTYDLRKNKDRYDDIVFTIDKTNN